MDEDLKSSHTAELIRGQSWQRLSDGKVSCTGRTNNALLREFNLTRILASFINFLRTRMSTSMTAWTLISSGWPPRFGDSTFEPSAHSPTNPQGTFRPHVQLAARKTLSMQLTDRDAERMGIFDLLSKPNGDVAACTVLSCPAAGHFCGVRNTAFESTF